MLVAALFLIGAPLQPECSTAERSQNTSPVVGLATPGTSARFEPDPSGVADALPPPKGHLQKSKLLAVLQPDLQGRPIQVLPNSARKGIVVFFVLSGCPNAQAYAPEMNRIA